MGKISKLKKGAIAVGKMARVWDNRPNVVDPILMGRIIVQEEKEINERIYLSNILDSGYLLSIELDDKGENIRDGMIRIWDNRDYRRRGNYRGEERNPLIMGRIVQMKTVVKTIVRNKRLYVNFIIGSGYMIGIELHSERFEKKKRRN